MKGETQVTWFQLVESQLSQVEPSSARYPTRPVPNSAMFLNPAQPVERAFEPPSKAEGSHLRLIKGANAA